jgi:hypothetical protein
MSASGQILPSVAGMPFQGRRNPVGESQLAGRPFAVPTCSPKNSARTRTGRSTRPSSAKSGVNAADGSTLRGPTGTENAVRSVLWRAYGTKSPKHAGQFPCAPKIDPPPGSMAVRILPLMSRS